MIRQGEALLEASPAAPNRYRVLGIVFQSQKRLLGLENSDRNRDALFDTCKELAQAPNEYADLRLEADLLLSERDLAAKNAALEERTKALAKLVARYRDTPAEAKSLMMASLIAPKLEAFALETEIFDTLSERFAGDPGVIEFIQRNLGVRRLDVLFAGTYTRRDGVSLCFPIDRMGHHCVMVFWSRERPDFEKCLKQIKEQQSKYPDRLEIYSFNLDELPDAGEATLRALDLDWTAMRLPGGRRSQAYRTYARMDPVTILTNAYGHALLTPNLNYGRGQKAQSPFKIDDTRVSHDRYLAQLQSLFIGDVLVADENSRTKRIRTKESVPVELLGAIQACFTPPPFRYRLTSAEALANYKKTETLCRDATARYPTAPDLWLVRDRRIIALLGMWNLAGEPKYLDQAVEEARASLATELPPGVEVVPRFCLAKEAIRRGDADPRSVLSDLIEATGGADAPASALAAAAVLALDAHAPDLHNRYRSRFLDAPDDGNPMLWSFVSFLRDRYHRFRLFKANYVRREGRSIRGYIVAHGEPPTTSRLPKVELKALDGHTLNLPQDTDGKLTLLMFVEPPADKAPAELSAGVRSVMKYATNLGNRHIHKELNVVAAFLCDDAKRVDALMKINEWTCQAAMVPDGLANPMVRRLGILSADRVPNVFLLRRDGTIAWQVSGLRYKAEYSHEYSVYLAMKVHAEMCETERAYRALKQRDFKKAARIFSGPFLPEKDERYRWRAPRFHGRALAQMGLKDWDAALADIDTAIDEHQQGFNHAAKLHPCDSMVEMQLTRAIILAKLGRAAEAKAARELATIPASPYPTTPYGLFHDKLKKFRLTQQ